RKACGIHRRTNEYRRKSRGSHLADPDTASRRTFRMGSRIGFCWVNSSRSRLALVVDFSVQTDQGAADFCAFNPRGDLSDPQNQASALAALALGSAFC